MGWLFACCKSGCCNAGKGWRKRERDIIQQARRCAVRQMPCCLPGVAILSTEGEETRKDGGDVSRKARSGAGMCRRSTVSYRCSTDVHRAEGCSIGIILLYPIALLCTDINLYHHEYSASKKALRMECRNVRELCFKYSICQGISGCGVCFSGREQAGHGAGRA